MLGIIGMPLIVVIRLLIVRHKVSGDVSLAEVISNLLVTCEEAKRDKTDENHQPSANMMQGFAVECIER